MTYELWLTNGKKRFRFPVLPGVLDVDNTSSNDSHRVSKLGEITVIQDPNLKGFSFSSFLPAEYAPYCEYRKIPKPWPTAKMIEGWMKSGNPVRFIFSGKINMSVTIEDFKYQERGGSVGDVYYDITLKEYKPIKVRRVTHKPAPRPSPPPPPKKPKVRYHTVKRGDTLWALAGKYYKNSLQWRRIWNVKANKDMMIKRDKRNLKQPGHWLYPGMKLIIP